MEAHSIDLPLKQCKSEGGHPTTEMEMGTLAANIMFSVLTEESFDGPCVLILVTAALCPLFELIHIPIPRNVSDRCTGPDSYAVIFNDQKREEDIVMTTEKKECNPVGWFEIPVTDMTRAKSFYEAVFKLPIEEKEMEEGMVMGWFPMSETGSGASGSLVKGTGYIPSLAGTLIYFSASDIDSTLDRVRNSGGNVISEKTSIGEYGFIACFEDSEGNRIGLHAMPA
jgi:hypothetical protein